MSEVVIFGVKMNIFLFKISIFEYKIIDAL